MGNEVKPIDPAAAVAEVREAVEKKVVEGLDSRFAAFEEKVNTAVRSIVAELKPKIEVEVEGPVSEWRAVHDQLAEKRAVTLNGSGAYKIINDIVMVIRKKYDLLDRARWEYGAGAQVNIPVLSARPAKPAKQNEGVTNIASDTSAVLGATTITPYAYVSVLPVSAEALTQSAANIEARLPEIFRDAFADAMMYGMIIGDSTMTGIFTKNTSMNLLDGTAHATAYQLVWGDILQFAVNAQGYSFTPLITINPVHINTLLQATGTNYDPLKYELMNRRTLRGIEIYETGYAPTAMTDEAVVSVAFDPKDYCIAVATELNIIPIRKPGDTNTYFQAEMFFNGKPVLNGNFFQLIAQVS